MLKTTVVIPSYNPDVKLSMLVDELIMSGFSDIVIIDDGSDFGIRNVETTFEYVKKKVECTILHHPTNLGKGMALKTGFKFCMHNRSKDTIVVTTDDDGHYSVSNMKECIELYEEKYMEESPVLIASRDFKDSAYSTKRRVFNRLAGVAMTYLCGVDVKDVQTGLRIIPVKYMKKLIAIEGERFNYEINMLVELKYNNIKTVEHIIPMEKETTLRYADYNPIWDIFRLIAVMLKYAVSSLAATVLDVAVFYGIILMMDDTLLHIDKSAGMLLATFVARVISSTFNCIVNKRTVFKSDEPMKRVIIKFYIFSLLRAAVSYGMVLGASYVLGSYADTATVVVKVLVDFILFFAGYGIQKKFIF